MDSTQQYASDWDNFSVVPWMLEEHFIKPWNRVAEACKYRKFVHSKSKGASAKRLSTIIHKNSVLLGGSSKTDMEVLAVRFFERWILFCDHIIENHQPDAEGMEILGTQYSIVRGPWQFISGSDIKNVIHISGLQLGDPDALKTLDQDKKRRQAKAELCRDFEAASREFVRRLTMSLGQITGSLRNCLNVQSMLWRRSKTKRPGLTVKGI